MFIPPFGYGLFDSGFQRPRRRYPVRVSPTGGAAKKRTWKRSVRAGEAAGPEPRAAVEAILARQR